MALRCLTTTSLLLVLALTGCYQGAAIELTIPANGEENVDPNTEILVRFSQNMDSESVSDGSNYVIRGSISGEHPVTANYDDSTQDLTMTAGAGDGGGDGGEDSDPTATEDPTATSGGGQDPVDGNPTIDPDDPLGSIAGLGGGSGSEESEDSPEADPDPQPAGDAFTFTPGETVTVTLRSSLISDISIPIDSKVFSFKIAGTPPSGFEPAANEFTVNSTTPTTGGEASSLSPTIEVRFSQPITRATAVFAPIIIPGFPPIGVKSLFVNGSESGDIAGTAEFLGGDGSTTATTMRLSGMTFAPGELVSISLTRVITSGGSTLRPYNFQFRIPGGQALQQPSAAAGLNFPADDIDHVLDLRIADVSPLNPGRELLVLGNDQVLRVLVKSSTGAWMSAGAIDLSPQGSNAVAMRVADTNHDGRLNSVVLFENGTIVEYQLSDFLVFQAVDTISPDVSVAATDFEIADFDSNGLLDVVMTDSQGFWISHQIETTVPSTEAGVPSTTDVSFSFSQYPVEGGFDSVAVGDIDSDGRVDLLLSGASGYRIFGNASQLIFQPVGTLSIQGLTVEPIIVDYEGDGDNDVVSSDGVNLFVFVNEGNGVPEGGDWTANTSTIVNTVADSIARGIDALSIRNVNGDPGHLPDLVYYDKDANVLGVRRRISTELHNFDNSAAGADSPVASTVEDAGLAIDDIDGDSGLDIVLFGKRPALGPAIFTRTAQEVTPVSPADYALSVPAVTEVTLDTVGQRITVVVSGTFSTDVESFTVAFSFDPGLVLGSVNRSEATFAEASDLDIDDARLDEGIVVCTPTVALAGQVGVPILEFEFTLREPEPGVFSYELSQGLATPNSMTLAGGSVVTPTLAPAAGQVVATSTVEAVENLVCETGAAEQVLLTWTLPSTPFDSAVGGIEIRRNGVFLLDLQGTTTEYIDTSPTAGGATDVTYSVRGSSGGIFSPPVECGTTVLPAPTITVCERDSGILDLQWESTFPFEQYQIAIDGTVVAILSSTSFSTPIDLNGHVIAVVGTISGGGLSAPATCTFEDEDTSVTAAPINVVAGLGTDRVNLSWTNTESYDNVVIRRIAPGGTVLLTDTLAGFVSAFEDEEPLLPGTYSYSVAGITGGVESVATQSNPVLVEVLPPFGLLCTPNGPDVQLDWQLGSTLYTSLEVFRDGLSIAVLPVDSTSFVDAQLLSGGVFEYFVRGVIAPDSADSQSCSVTLENRVRALGFDSPVGTLAAIDVASDLLSDQSGFSFNLEYDGARFTFDSVDVPGSVASDVTVNGPTVVSGTTVSLEVIVTNVVVPAGDNVLLARIFGSIPADFAAVGVTPLTLTDALVGTIVPTLVDGALNVVGDAVALSEHVVTPGQEFDVLVTATYDQDLLGVSFVIDYDPAVFTCEEVFFSQTVVDTFGSASLFTDIDQAAGFVHGSAVGILTDPLTPAFGQLIAFVKFTAAPTADGLFDLGLAESHVFPTSGATAHSTLLIPSTGAAGIVPFLLPGLVAVEGEPVPPTVTAIDPTTGESAGGTDVTITGTGFTSDLTVEFGGVPATVVTLVDAQTLVATTPAATDGAVNVTVTSGTFGSIVAPEQFVFFTPAPLTITSVSPTVAIPCVSVDVTLTGSAFEPGMVVVFDTGTAEHEATLSFVSSDGTTATVQSPIVSGRESSVAVRVTVGTESSELPSAFSFSEEFIRGDVNFDGVVDSLDFDFLAAAFSGGPLPGIVDSADINDDGLILIDDLIVLRDFIVGTITTLPAPFPAAGVDPTADGLTSVCDPTP